MKIKPAMQYQDEIGVSCSTQRACHLFVLRDIDIKLPRNLVHNLKLF